VTAYLIAAGVLFTLVVVFAALFFGALTSINTRTEDDEDWHWASRIDDPRFDDRRID
jgi:hypothetical protein